MSAVLAATEALRGFARERERMAGVIDELIQADDSELLLMTSLRHDEYRHEVGVRREEDVYLVAVVLFSLVTCLLALSAWAVIPCSSARASPPSAFTRGAA